MKLRFLRGRKFIWATILKNTTADHLFLFIVDVRGHTGMITVVQALQDSLRHFKT